MTYQRLEVITGSERRRCYSDEEKARLVEEAFRPGVIASAVARRHGLNVSLLYRWRRLLSQPPKPEPGFLAVAVTPDPVAAPGAVGLIEIELATGAHPRQRRCRGGVGGPRRPDGSGPRAMIPVPGGTRVWLATGHTDMRKGWASLALLVQERLNRDPHGGHIFI